MTTILKTLLTAVAVIVVTAQTAAAVDRAKLAREVPEALTLLKQKDSTFEASLKKAHGYAVFPNVGKGGFIVGGAGGEAEVYEKGKLIGHARLSQATIGAQIGGQTFIQVILFETRESLRRFRESRTEFSAQVSAVAAAEGAAAGAKYDHGVAVIILPKKGLMAEASIGGQKFTFIGLPPQGKD